MKKAVSILLAAVILLLCVSMTAAAANTKISDALQMKMAEMPDNAKIEAHIWLYCPIDKNEVFRQAVKECGYIGGLPLDMTIEEVHAYRAVYNRIVSEQEAAVADAFVKKLGIADEDIVYHGKHNYVVANLTKAQLREADTCSEVESIGCADGAIAASPTELLVEAPTEASKPRYLYQEQFERTYVNEENELARYRELYYHYDENGDPDWVLVDAMLNMFAPMPLYTVIANRVIVLHSYALPFDTCYGIYDVKAAKFKDLNHIDTAAYSDLEKVFDEIGGGRLLGDIDGDDAVTVVDATIIQRCEADLRDYPDDDMYHVTKDYETPELTCYYSDFDRDGVRDVIDATCIQRYLADLPCPRGK